MVNGPTFQRLEIAHDGFPLSALLNRKKCLELGFEYSAGGCLIFQKNLIYLARNIQLFQAAGRYYIVDINPELILGIGKDK